MSSFKSQEQKCHSVSCRRAADLHSWRALVHLTHSLGHQADPTAEESPSSVNCTLYQLHWAQCSYIILDHNDIFITNINNWRLFNPAGHLSLCKYGYRNTNLDLVGLDNVILLQNFSPPIETRLSDQYHCWQDHQRAPNNFFTSAFMKEQCILLKCCILWMCIRFNKKP